MSVRRPVPPHVRASAAIVAMVLAGSASYTVQPGETLSGIAARHDVAVSSLARANGLADPHRVLAGQQLQLPGSSPAAGQHEVRRGDTLWSLSARYGLSVGALARANRLASPDHLVAGARLVIPAGQAPTASDAPADEPATGHAATAVPPPPTNVPPGPPARSLTRAEVGRDLERVARDYGWNPAFVKALAWQESGWQQHLVSSAGAIGVMQVLPSTGRFVSRHLVDRELDLTDREDNIVAGVAFLDYLHRLTGGDPERILGGYYQGLRSMDENGVYPDTQRYIANVLLLRERFG